MSPTPTITFHPSSIIFRNYSETEKTFEVRVANSINGTFVINYTKTEGTEIFYNDIPEETFKIVEPVSKYWIKVRNVDRKSVGKPIKLRVVLQKPNSKELNILYSHNCTSQYSFNPSTFIVVPAGDRKAIIYVTYSGDTIPEMCVIDFETSSFSKNNYELKNTRMYITGSRSIDKGATVVPMRLKITPNFELSKDVGDTVLNRVNQKIKPKFYKIKDQSVGANAATFVVSTSEEGVVYYAIMRAGTTQDKVTQEEIYNETLSTGLIFGNEQTAVTNNLATIQSSFTVTGLEAQKTYLVGAYLNSSVGNSDIKFTEFTTQKTSNGGAIKIAFSAIVDHADVIEAFSKVLRIAPERMAISTVKAILVFHRDRFEGTIMNERRYVYEILVGPNLYDDSLSVVAMLRQFKKTTEMEEKMSNFVSSYDPTFRKKIREIVPVMSKFRRKNNGIKVDPLTHDSATVIIKM